MKRTILALPLALLLWGCPSTTPSTPAPPKTPIQKAVIAEADISDSIGQLQTAVIMGNQQGIIPDAVVAKILNITVKLALSDQQATNITKGLTTLTPAQQASIVALFTPMLAAISDSITNGLIPIKNVDTANSIRLLLTTLQGTLSGLQIALSGSN